MDLVAPAVAAALHQLGVLDPAERPLLAAHWVAAGLGGEVLADLAGLRRGDRVASDLWPAALAELGVGTPVVLARRVAAPWLAQQVLRGERDLDDLVGVLWPTAPEPPDGDEELDRVVYTIDDVLDWTGDLTSGAVRRGRRGRRVPPEHAERAQRAVDAVATAVAALAAGDVLGAVAALRAGG